MKFEKNNSTIATTRNLPGVSRQKEVVISGALIKEVLVTLIGVLSIGFWIRSCMAMEDPIFLQKAIICSFIIIVLIFHRRSSFLK